MACWCEEYHSYELGTKKLTLCEHSCHSNDRKWRATQYTDSITYVRSEPRPYSHEYIMRIRSQYPTYHVSELYIDEDPDRWIYGSEE